MSFESGKNMAGVGAILIFASSIVGSYAIPFAGGALGIIGLIIMLVGINNLAGYYREPGIFNNMLYAALTEVVGAVVAIVVAIGLVLNSLTSFLYKIFPGWDGNWMSLSGMTPVTTNLTLSDVIPFITAGIAIFAVLVVTAIIYCVFARRSLSLLRNRSGVNLFGTIGTVLLIGGILTIFFIGYLIIWLAFLILAIAFFQLTPKPVEPAQTTQIPTPP